MKLIFHFFLVVTLCLTSITFTQDDARWNSANLYIMASGNYVPLPQQPYVHPVTQPWVVKTPYEDILVFPNIRVLPGSVSQTEVPLVISRINPQLMFGSSNAYPDPSINSGSYISTNGGTSWFGFNHINNGNTNNQRGDPGPAYGANNRLIFTHLSSNTAFGGVTGMAAEYSTDFGQTFSSSFQVHTNANDDKNLACGDDVPSSPYYGNFYMAFCDYVTGTSFCARTTNGGVSWVAPVSWAPPGGLFAQGHDVVTRPNGDVIVCYALHVNASPWTETSVGIGRSTDGGVTFTPIQPAYSTHGTRSTSFNGWGIRTNGFPRIACDKSGGSRNGWLYCVMSENQLAPAGNDADVVLHRSTDGGLTWSAGIRVNQDALNNGKVQWFPAVSVDENGGVNVAYYDNRNFASVGDSCSVFISRSVDGGNSWSDIEVADHHFRPKFDPNFAGGYMGDYIGCASGNGKAWAFWMDDKAGPFNAWAGYIQTGPPPVNDIVVGPFLSLPSSFVAGINYTIKAKFTNGGTANQTNVPTRFSVNGVLSGSGTIASLPSGVSDSASFTWNPSSQGTYTLRIYSAAGVDENRLNDTVTTTVNVSPAGTVIAQTTFCRNGLNKPILDNQTTYDTITLNISNGFNVRDVNVRIDTVIHTYDGDMGFSLSHLAANVTIINHVGGGGDNFINTVLNDSASTPISSGTAPFTGTFQPSSPLTPYNNNPVNGIWVLAINDNASADQGTLRAWCIQVTYETLLGGIQTAEVPNQFYLNQNYPNPFNPVTTIKYGIPKSANVTLKIYDMLGREVTTLVNEKKDPGTYNIEFDATNFASGLYLYKITAGDFSAVKKMMLIK